MTYPPRRIVLDGLGAAGERVAARVLSRDGAVIAVLAEPTSPPDAETLRDAAIRAALEEDFGDIVLAGVAFAPAWGGDAIGFT